MELWSEINKNSYVSSALLFSIIVITSILKYKKQLYFNFDEPNDDKYLLNRKYKLKQHRKYVDVAKINKQLFMADAITLIVSGLVMFITEAFIGFVLYLIISNLSIYFTSIKIGEDYSKLIEKNYCKRKKQKKIKKK